MDGGARVVVGSPDRGETAPSRPVGILGGLTWPDTRVGTVVATLRDTRANTKPRIRNVANMLVGTVANMWGCTGIRTLPGPRLVVPQFPTPGPTWNNLWGGRDMFPLGILVFFASYAMAYTGVANLLNGGSGPTLSESLGFKMRLAPPGAQQVQSNPIANTNIPGIAGALAQGTGQIQGGFSGPVNSP